MIATNRRRTKENDPPIPASRPLLIFNHNPKAGGGSILQVIRGFKSREIFCSEIDAHNHPPSGCDADAWHEIFDERDRIDDTFLHVKEFATTTALDHRAGFVLGSIREPCSQYLSLWSWGSNGHGAFRQKSASSDLYGVSPPYFNTTADKKRFLAWMRDPSVIGEIADRVQKSYGEHVLDTVDCWVFVEKFQETLLGCLRMYEDQGGFVDWETPEVAELVTQEADNEDHHLQRRRRRRRRRMYAKDDPLGDPRLSHHEKCQNMFDASTAKEVEEGAEAFVYDLFGYEGCCKSGFTFHPTREPLGIATTTNETLITATEAMEDVTHETNEPTALRSDVPFVHSIRISKQPSANNDVDGVSTIGRKSFFVTPENQEGNSIDVLSCSAMVISVTGIFLLSFCRFLWKPRRA